MLSKKVGENPPVAELRPEEVPLIATMYDENDESRRRTGQSSVDRENSNKTRDNDADEGPKDEENDDEIQPQNYFF